MPSEMPIETLSREFRRLKILGEKGMAQISDDAFFEKLGGGHNSIAIIVKHLAGNMHSRWRDFLTTDGEKADRNRDTEFDVSTEDTRDLLMSRWESGWQVLFGSILPLSCEDLDRTVTIRGEPLTVLQALVRQLGHYSYHTGQIVFLAKYHAGEAWQSLSVPRGESEQFNTNPTSYL